eukprot:gene12652-12748_t
MDEGVEQVDRKARRDNQPNDSFAHGRAPKDVRTGGYRYKGSISMGLARKVCGPDLGPFYARYEKQGFAASKNIKFAASDGDM